MNNVNMVIMHVVTLSLKLQLISVLLLTEVYLVR